VEDFVDAKLDRRRPRSTCFGGFAALLVAVPLGGNLGCSAGGDNGSTTTTSGPSGGGGDDGRGGGDASRGAGGAGGQGEGAGEAAPSAVSVGQTGGTGGFEECATTTEQATSQKQPADIIVVVDTSGSMSEEAAQVQQNLNTFVDVILGSGIDTHVVLIADATVCIPAALGSGQCAGGDTNLPAFLHVLQTVASTDALQLTIATYSQWSEVLRPDATKTFLVVSDDNSDMGAGEFTSALLALDPSFTGFKFTAITAYSNPLSCFGFSCPQGNPCCYSEGFGCSSYADAEGTVYHDLVAQTGGVGGDLCLQQFQPIFDELAEGVIISSQLSCEFDIPDPGEGETLDPGLVNVRYRPAEGAEPIAVYYVDGAAACGPPGGWYYDDASNPTKIIACPTTCDALQASVGGSVEVVFGCETEIAPPA